MEKQLSKQEKIQLFAQKFPNEAQIIETIRDKKLTYCGYPKLENICQVIDDLKQKNVPGIYLEAGCALGGSAILIAKTKPRSTPLYLFDVFATIPPPSERDGVDAHIRYEEIASGKSKGLGDNIYYGYLENLEDTVVSNLENFGLNLELDRIKLIKGLFEETLYIQDLVAFAHIDCDWYDSVKVCIDRITPKMSSGAVIVFDDYNSYSGCKVAVDELLADNEFNVVCSERSIILAKR
jgi:asparagine synthase (glutamine-hydrolysing)